MNFQRKLIKNNRGSYYLNIPKKLVQELKWKDNQIIDVKKQAKGIFAR